ncbi:MAG: DUF971 domain-containing protein [Halothiobacillaceae bacterium]|mgnify:CR=1 FL=1|nr:DUF971 domain-containing protein [Halothiobacillaceae bacterium]
MRHTPTDIILHRVSGQLEIAYADGARHRLDAEYLRVYSPSAEVRGHGLPEPLLVPGKEGVRIAALEPVGQYALKIVFDDGHDSGLYDWDLLHDLGETRSARWQHYLDRLAAAGLARTPTP